jgi:hypothetical protein
MSSLTIFLSRLIGIFSLLVAVTMASHRDVTVDTVTALIHNPPAVLIAGVIAVAIGLAIVLGHNVWSGGPLAVIVTLVGWYSLLKGLVLFLLSPVALENFFDGAHYGQFFFVYMGVTFILGACLTYGGFTAKPR